jgi:uncharacterized protein
MAALLLLYSSLVCARLNPEQQAAKERGLMLYNQYKAISAVPFLTEAAEAGVQETQYFLGEALRKNNRYMTKEASKWYITAANQGDYYAMFRLTDTGSDLCSAMNNCTQESKSTADWTRSLWKTAEPLANEGDGEAMMIIYNSTGELEWLERSAQAGYARAQWLLASRYSEGEGFFILPWKRQEAVEKWFKASAEGGNPKGIIAYAHILHEEGDIAGVRHWMEEASKLGHVDAVSSYGAYVAHNPDLLDYPLDLIKGYALIYLLQELDGGGNMQVYVEDTLPEIAAKMTPEQIEEAKVFAKEWKATHPPLSLFPEKLGF